MLRFIGRQQHKKIRKDKKIVFSNCFIIFLGDEMAKKR
jgi:hypothetical protein